MTKLSIITRITTGLFLIISMIAFGYMHRSPISIAILTPVFTILYAHGKKALWLKAFRYNTKTEIIQMIAVTALTQAIVIGVFYLIGLGLGGIFEPNQELQKFAIKDIVAALSVFVVGIIGGNIAHYQENKSLQSNLQNNEYNAEDKIELEPYEITLENFFEGKHFSQSEIIVPTQEMIEDTEKRLNIKFPPLLRKLYEQQNGGRVGWLAVPTTENPKNNWNNWRGAFAIDYCDLLPLESLRTLYDSYMDFTDPENPEEMNIVPENADKMIILAQRYMDTTYLDYSEPGEPRIGIVDFDNIEKNVFFDNFDNFFAALKRVQF